MTMKTPAPAYSHPVAVATLHGENHLRLVPDEAARKAIARALGLHAVDRLEARLAISHAQSGLVSVEGELEADVQPLCVVTLDAFPQAIREPVSLRLAPTDLVERMTKRAEEEENEDFEPPDTIDNGVIDFGALAVEFLALALDPYPRRPGAEFKGTDPLEPKPSPFEALKALKIDRE
ncbi:MAG TPA: DUF177 domain-containing protein [Rhabdaerophilum sp.]|nr:DUF177 domain-containing protein [Rhabdaerophilum sp.]